MVNHMIGSNIQIVFVHTSSLTVSALRVAIFFRSKFSFLFSDKKSNKLLFARNFRRIRYSIKLKKKIYSHKTNDKQTKN